MNNQASSSLASIFLTFLKLGCISFGGPIAHLGYFRQEFVARRKWLSEEAYAELVALCQFLPGPASSQVGMVLGYSQKNYMGAIAAWLGFTLPSACLLILLATGLTQYGELIAPEFIHGLKLLAVAVVIQAVWSMAKTLCPDWPRILMMVIVAILVLIFSSVIGSQLLLMLLAAIAGSLWLSPSSSNDRNINSNILVVPISHLMGFIFLGIFFFLLLLLPLLAYLYPTLLLEMISACYRVGSLVFGGGHVVLPLLETEFVATQWLNQETFLAGYGVTQVMPGPLFTFAAFLGASITSPYSAWVTGGLALLAIFIPSFLLVMGALPFWISLRQYDRLQAAFMGVNAGVVGILLAALYQPIASHAIHDLKDVGLVLLAWWAMTYQKLPVWLVAILMVVLAYAMKLSF